jgi:hypothetical protein
MECMKGNDSEQGLGLNDIRESYDVVLLKVCLTNPFISQIRCKEFGIVNHLGFCRLLDLEISLNF